MADGAACSSALISRAVLERWSPFPAAVQGQAKSASRVMRPPTSGLALAPSDKRGVTEARSLAAPLPATT